MKLDVLHPPSGEKNPWYADGLNFTCTQCGNCCTGGPGFVWVSKEEIIRLAEFLHITPQETVERYCRKIDGRFSFKEARNNGSYDCIFLREEKLPRPAKSRDDHDAAVLHTRRSCAIYPVRPLQCRTWPFWDSNLASPENWDRASRRCPGMGSGHRHFTLRQIESLRDATDWPKNPPTSAAKP